MLFESLTGVQVLDFTQIGAGPTCTMFLGDLGASVIKVEPPNGDTARTLGPPWCGDDSAMLVAFNRNKKSVCIDMKRAEGREVVRRMIRGADVLVESFRPGVMRRFGLDYESLRGINPKVIYCSVSAYGQSGPYAERAGVDGIIQAASGLMSLIGEPNGEPCKVQAPVVDVTTGYIAAIAVLAALNGRGRTGEGDYLDVSLFASAVALQQSSITGYLGNGELPLKLGSAAPYAAPNEALPTQDGWIMVAAYTPDRWNALCRVLDAPELLTDGRFTTSSERVAHRPDLRKALSTLFRRDTTRGWMERLEQADILCSPVASYADLMQHPQVGPLGLMQSLDGGESSKSLRTPSFPVNTTEPRPAQAPPRFGQHTTQVLARLGYTPQDIDALCSAGVVRLEQRGLPPMKAEQRSPTKTGRS
jgi:crotonobetainyl-CoA:carnitine CoA-transferase CaiB-like acyl-CoA transferase